MFLTFDLLTAVVSLAAQICIHAMASRAIDRHLDGSARFAARSGVWLLDAAVAVGFVCSLSSVAADLPFPPHVSTLLGAFTLVYLILAVLCLAVHAAFLAAKKIFASGVDPSRRNALRTAQRAAMVIPAAALGYGFFIERLHFTVKEVDIPSPGLPPDLDGMRILHLSDVHLGAFLSEKQFARVIDASNELRPKLVLVTGDFISVPGDPLDACIAQLARLRSDAGTFGCLGNHERYAGVENYATDRAARSGIRILRSETAPLAFGNSLLNLVGVDYQRWNPNHDYLHGASRFLASDAWNVLLSHSPDVLPSAAREGYNLVLSGHTHGGQVAIEILDQSLNPARFFTRYVHGLYRAGATAGYVTRGIGTIGLPVRFGAPPEISLLRLRKV